MGRNKGLRKKIQGEINIINEHLAKIAAENEKPYPSYWDIRKWEEDIAWHLRILSRLREKLPGGKA